MCHDDDELVRVASVRAVGRMAEPGHGGGEGIETLCFFCLGQVHGVTVAYIG